MSTTVSFSATATSAPAFPAPIPITYSWSTPNALRRLALPPLATTPPPPHPSSASVAGPSRSRPVGARRPLPRPPRNHQYQTTAPEEYGRIPFPDPYIYQLPPSLVHHYQPQPQPQSQPHPQAQPTPPPAPRQLDGTQNYLVPLVQETNRLSFSEPPAPPERERGRSTYKAEKEKDKKNGGVERRISVSGIVARFRRKSRSRSRSATRDGSRNLLDDE